MPRHVLRTRRPSIQFPFAWKGVSFIGYLGFDDRQQPMEVFLSCSKTTSDFEALGRDAAILISLPLQHGCDFDTMRGAITRGEKGEAATLVGRLLDEIEEIDAVDAE